MGLVKPFCFGVCVSRQTRMRPDLTWLMVRMFNSYREQYDPDFRYTTVQMIRNYNAKSALGLLFPRQAGPHQ